MRKYYKEYLLLKDTIYSESGEVFKWSCWTQKYECGEEKVTIEKIESLPQFFKPLGEQYELYKEFPEDLREHFYFGGLRHNQMCSFCAQAQEIIDSKEYEEEVTKLFKKLYDRKIERLSK